ncbi:hypothetical protein D3C86_1629730 [compost metagenome]
MAHRGSVCVVDLFRVMAAARELPDVFVAQVADQFQQLGVFAKKMLTYVSAVLRLVVLIVAVHAFHHPLA